LILDLLDDEDRAPDVNVIPPPPAEPPPPHPPEPPVKPPSDGNDPVHPLDRRDD
jgi:hypothetical protein